MAGQLSSLKSYFSDLLATERSVCLWFSGGADSRLLLEVMLEQKRPFGILRFDNGWTREQKALTDAVIMKHNLQVFRYPPVTSFLVANGTEISLVNGYAIEKSSKQALIVRDFVEDTSRCSFDAGFKMAPDALPRIEFAVHVWGTRSEDRHWTVDGALAAPEWKVGTRRFLAPLWDWTRDEVIAALAGYGVEPPAVDTGDLHYCTRCLTATAPVMCPKEGKEIPPAEWGREGNAALLKQLLGFREDPAGHGAGPGMEGEDGTV